MKLRDWPRAWKRHVSIPFRSRVSPLADVHVRGNKMRVDLRDYPIGQTLYLDGDYEPALARLMRQMDLKGSISLDIGANIGLHTLTMSKLVGEAGRVFAFEPENHNFQLLTHNLRRHSNVTLYQYAVSDREGFSKIALSPTNYGDHRITSSASENWKMQDVRMTSIDSLLNQVPDGAIRLIKVDVQGHELHVLTGMKQMLDRNPDVILVIEVAPDLLAHAGTSAKELMSLLKSWGFTGWELHEHRIVPVSEPWAYDLIQNNMWVDVVLSRNAKTLRSVMTAHCGIDLPSNGGSSRF